MKQCCEKQLVDFLPGAKYGSELSEEQLQNTSNSHLMNLSCEFRPLAKDHSAHLEDRQMSDEDG